MAEPVTLEEAKQAVGLLDDDSRNDQIEGMIVRARKWVEDHTGVILVQRAVTEIHTPDRGAIQLYKEPLVSIDTITYEDSEGDTVEYEGARFVEGSSTIFPALNESWPTLTYPGRFSITYTAGVPEGEVDERLIGAMIALIQGEFSEGFAYPQSAIDAADRCCGQLRPIFE